MNLHIEERSGDDIAFYIDGDLQFDSTDEVLYHEGLALPPLTLARASNPSRGLRVLICGGGDGLALRECLRFPGVAQVDLVDYSPEVVGLGRTAFASLNERAFEDPRANIHIADAWEFLAGAERGTYDVILCDFTVPRQVEDGRVFTREWYARVREALSAEGVAGLNAVSPQRCPEAFWCLRRTVRASGLNALPMRVCIPSFRDQGYGAWGFLLAAHRRLRRADLEALAACPVPARGLDLARLRDAAGFTMAERRREALVPVHTLEQPVLLPLLLNPGGAKGRGGAATAEPPSLEALLKAIPILHPYHTRVMVESLAEQVIGSVRTLDLRRLLDALLEQGHKIGQELRRELASLRSFLTLGDIPRIELWGDWARRLFVALVLLLTLANIVGPDNVYGKGASGIGHASVSRGYSSGGFGHAEGGSFGHGPSGFRASGRALSSGGEARGPGSFARRGSFGGSGFHTDSSAPDAPLSGSGFRGGWQRGQAADIFGNSYRPQVFRYRVAPTTGHAFYVSTYDSGYIPGGGGGISYASAAPAPQEQRSRFVADDDMLVLENGDVVVTLSDSAYLLVSGGKVALMSQSSPDPVMPLFSDPRLLANISARLSDQRTAAVAEIKLRRDWLTWVGWTSALFPVVRADQDEVKNLEDLVRRLDAASKQIPPPAADAPLPPDLPDALSTDAIELFAGGGLLSDGRVALVDGKGDYWFTDGKTLAHGNEAAKIACPAVLSGVIRSILPHLEKEMKADVSEAASDLSSLQSDRTSLDQDLRDYTSLYNANGASYSVDYGTDEISAQDALDRTKRDIAQNEADVAETIKNRQKTEAQIVRIQAAEAAFRQ